MTEDEKVTFEERKAIVMIDGQMPESYANIVAWREIEEKREKENDRCERIRKSDNKR